MVKIDLSKLKFDSVVIQNDLRQAREQVVKPILDQVESLGYSSQDQFALRLGLEEAMCNAYHHGNKGDPCKTISARWCVNDHCIVVFIKDDGDGFVPQNVPDPRLVENLEKPCGRGVMLMRAYMTELRFNECGNEVCMIKVRDTKNQDNN
jgi:serine/threonine-protein kinase RsbW